VRVPRWSLALVLFVSACHGAHATERERTPVAQKPSTRVVRHEPEPALASRSAPVAPSRPAPPSIAVSPATPPPRCPSEMVLVIRPQDAFCVDRFEASLELVRPNGERTPWPGNRAVDGREGEISAVSAAGRMPQGYINADQAARACTRAEKRLCAIDEWTRACRGPTSRRYPYGDERRAGACNDRFRVLDAHPVARLFDQVAPEGMPRARMWEPFFMNDPRLHELPRSVEPTGARPECVSEAGAYDLVGNLHEWVADPEGTFVGGFFMDTLQNGEGCEYRTTAHRRDYHDYSTGFRCCRDAIR
jgi:hypothetical protein